MRDFPTIFLASLLLLFHVWGEELHAAGALRVLQGDGITLRVLALSDDETRASGELIQTGESYAFTARLISDEKTAVIEGGFGWGTRTGSSRPGFGRMTQTSFSPWRDRSIA